MSSHPSFNTELKMVASVTAVMLEENFIRREKRRKLETQREIEKLRAELPNYDLNQIREFKLPFYEALLLQLEETGYVSTEAYIKQLFELQEKERNEALPQSNTWNLPLLIQSEKELRKLSESLMMAEDQHNEGNYRGETDTLLRVATHFAFNYNEWFWLGNQLIQQCLHIATCFKTTGKREAIARYVYAKVLIELVKDYATAEEQLNIARELSTGKSWNVKEFFPVQNDSTTLFMNANYLLHICYMRQARHFFKSSPQRSVEYAILAKKRANEACFHDGETSALLLKGQCELNLGDTKSAVSTFNKAYYIQLKLKSEKGMCEARVELSKAYLMHGNPRLALKTLLALKEMAEQYGFQYYLAQAYRFLGEYYLNNGEPNKATPLLSDALHIFHSCNNIVEADKVRNLEALSAGLELMPEYIALIQKTDRRCQNWFDNLMKLVMWKDSRQPFWIAKEDGTGKEIGPSTSTVAGTILSIHEGSASLIASEALSPAVKESVSEIEKETDEQIEAQRSVSFFVNQEEVETGHGNPRLALKTLLALKEMAEQYGFQYYLAQAYRFLGEYYLNNGEPNKATPLLSDALHIFHSCNNIVEADKVRNLEALSAGLELMPEYIALIQKTDRRCQNWFDNLMKLVMWKDSRQPFWIAKEDGTGKEIGPSTSTVAGTILSIHEGSASLIASEALSPAVKESVSEIEKETDEQIEAQRSVSFFVNQEEVETGSEYLS